MPVNRTPAPDAIEGRTYWAMPKHILGYALANAGTATTLVLDSRALLEHKRLVHDDPRLGGWSVPVRRSGEVWSIVDKELSDE